MRIGDDHRLVRECQVFTYYLSGLEFSPYVLQKYLDAHEKVIRYHAASRFDRVLLRFAAAGPNFTRLADSYARVFAPASTLRTKLILLLAILESTPLGGRFLGSVDTENRGLLVLSFALRGLVFLVRFLLATVVLLPVQLTLCLLEGRAEGGS
jgi:hypothetical protein